MVLSGVAVVATGLVVSSGIALQSQGSGGAASASLASTAVRTDPARTSPPSPASPSRADLAARTRSASRSDRRPSADAVKKSVLNQGSGAPVTRTRNVTSQDPRTIARAMLPRFGFGSDQFSCLDSLYTGESGWNIHADNPSSSAYGIPQALPGSKMASAGSDWQTNPATQIRWGLGYIKASYGTPCGAWAFKQGHNWY